MIVMLHSGSHGKTLLISEGLTPYSIWFHFVEALTICSVDVFVLISGYFLCTQQFKLSRIIKLYFAVVFYSIAWMLISTFVYHQPITQSSIINALLPITNNQYWFISCYVGLYIMSPIINVLIRGLTQIQHIGAIIILVGLFSLWPDIFIGSNPLGITQKGYTLVWFVVLYIIAAYFRKYPVIIRPKRALLGYFMAVTILVLIWMLLVIVTSTSSFEKELQDGFTFYYFRYNSLLVLAQAVFLWLVFLNIKVDNRVVQRVVAFIAPLMMGVYLIHDNRAARDVIWQGLRGIEPTIVTPFMVIGYVCAVFVGCILVDKMRSLFFSIITKRKWFKSILAKIDNMPCRISTVISKKMLNN